MGEPTTESKRPRRSRRRRKSKALAPLADKPVLDLSADRPISTEERPEIERHLAFIRRYKGELRLKLNAAEDLLVNGAASPEDRGVLKHLFQKIDRAVVEQALHREPFKSNASERVKFLGGVVRIDPSLPSLLDYLETLAGMSDRRDAARAFSLTVERVEFDKASNAQVARIVDLSSACFSGHDFTQATLGLLGNASFRAAIDRAMDRLSETARITLAELSLAEQTALRGRPLPEDEEARERARRGVDRILAAPDAVLRSYSTAVRQRLAEVALEEDPFGDALRSLIDSLPHHDPAYAAFGLTWAEKLMASSNAEGPRRARAILEQVVQSHPKLERARERLVAIGWPRLGRVTLMPSDPARHPRRGFWLDGGSFVWVLLGKNDDRARFEAEAELQARLTLPAVLPLLAHGVVEDGTCYRVIAPRGRELTDDRAQRPLIDLLDLARAGLALLKSLALAAVELPDVDRKRFSIEGRAGLSLFDLSGARSSTSERAEVAHAPLAQVWYRDMLSGRTDLPVDLRELMNRRKPLAMMLATIDRARARLER